MAFGYEQIGSHGRIQLGVGLSNFYLVEKGTLAVSGGTEENPRVDTVPSSLPYDYLALGGPVRVAAPGMADNYPFDGLSNNVIYSSSDGTVNWYTFRSYKHLTPGATDYHVEIYNPDAPTEVTFTTRYPKIMKSGPRYTMLSLTENWGNHTLPSGKTWAFMRYGIVRRVTNYNDDEEVGLQHWRRYPEVVVSGTTLTISQEGKQDGLWPDNGVSEFYAGGIIAIDVTGY